MPQKRKATIMVLSKTRNYHIHNILYNIYEDNIFQDISITAPYFIKETSNFGHCMEIIYATSNPYHIATSKKQLDKA